METALKMNVELRFGPDWTKTKNMYNKKKNGFPHLDVKSPTGWITHANTYRIFYIFGFTFRFIAVQLETILSQMNSIWLHGDSF